jgi:gas vesicle protein
MLGMDEKPKQVAKDTEKFEGVGRSGVVLLESTVWFIWGHLAGMVAGAVSTLFVKKDTTIGKFPLGEYIEKWKWKKLLGAELPQFLQKSPLLLGGLGIGWVVGGVIGFVAGGLAGIPDSDRGERQFKRMQGKLNDALEENAALKEKLGGPKPTVHADTLVKSETNLAPAEVKAQAV